MIPTWTDHAHELARCARKDTRNIVVSIVRYVAHLSATIQEHTHSAPQEPPMTTPEERHEADQDDADRYARTSVLLTSQRAHVAELKTEVERLRVKYNAALDKILALEAGREERDATIERLTYDRNHPYGDVHPATPSVFCTCNGMDSWTGVDQAPNGPNKVWRCDTCGRLIELSRSAASHRFVVPIAPSERLRQANDRAWFSYLINCPVCRAKARS